MRTSVLIPYKGGCRYRAVALNYVRTWYERHHPDWEVVGGVLHQDQPWSKGEAVAEALRHTSADILVIADADSITPDVKRAVQAVERGRAWAMAHHTVHRLTWAATMKVLNHQGWPSVIPQDRKNYVRQPYVAMAGGGVTVLHRDVYLNTPIDHRFLGWGQEDGVWGNMLALTYGRPWRSPHTRLWHLWHPPQPKGAQVSGPESATELRRQYRDAHTVEAAHRVLMQPRLYVQQILNENPQAHS